MISDVEAQLRNGAQRQHNRVEPRNMNNAKKSVADRLGRIAVQRPGVLLLAGISAGVFLGWMIKRK